MGNELDYWKVQIHFTRLCSYKVYVYNSISAFRTLISSHLGKGMKSRNLCKLLIARSSFSK